MRVTAVFNRLLALPGISVRGVSFTATDKVEVTVALRRKKLVCPWCDHTSWARHDTRPVASTWRHLDLGRWRVQVRAELRRIHCPEQGIRVEGVSFARPVRSSPATSRTWSPTWPPRPTRPRSPG